MTAASTPRGFKGRLLRPGDADFAAAAKVDNMAFDARRPALIAQAVDTADVAAAIRFARETGLAIAIRSGGHSVAGHSTGDGVLVLDVGGLKRLEIDTLARSAWAGPGVRAGEYTRAAHEHGLATTFGDTGSVGLGGLIVGGGIGWLVRRDGLTIDSLLAAEVVTADGTVIVASADEHPDLLWALRGGGGNAGVVTGYRLALNPIGPVVHGTLLYRATADVVDQLLPLGLAAPDELTLMPTVMAIPPIDEVPAEVHGQLGVFVDLLWSGQPAAAGAAIAPFRGLGDILLDTIMEKAYPEVYPERSGLRSAWTARSIFLDDLGPATFEVIERELAVAPAGDCLAHLRILGGAAARVPAAAAAFAWRDRPLLAWLIADAGETDAAGMAAHAEWVAGFRRALAGRGSGGFVSFMGDDGAAAVEAAYPPATLGRLREIKQRYDPDNLFRLNHNIAPAG